VSLKKALGVSAFFIKISSYHFFMMRKRSLFFSFYQAFHILPRRQSAKK
jgi:hypothetical protein